MKNIILVRHGTTDWVDQQILHGITDIPLNKNGQTQAEQTAAALKNSGAQKVYTSSLIRCVQTAQTIGNAIGKEPILMESLIELNFGWLEGKHFHDHDKVHYGKLIEFFDNLVFNSIRAISGESKHKLNKRVLAGWSKILEENPTGTIILVAHSAVFNSIILNYFGQTYLNGDLYYHLDPCSITEIRIDDSDQAKLLRLNDRSHLSGKNR